MKSFYALSHKRVQQQLHKDIETNNQYVWFVNGAPTPEFQQGIIDQGWVYLGNPTQVDTHTSEK